MISIPKTARLGIIVIKKKYNKKSQHNGIEIEFLTKNKK